MYISISISNQSTLSVLLKFHFAKECFTSFTLSLEHQETENANWTKSTWNLIALGKMRKNVKTILGWYFYLLISQLITIYKREREKIKRRYVVIHPQRNPKSTQYQNSSNFTNTLCRWTAVQWNMWWKTATVRHLHMVYNHQFIFFWL
jgi:hypothetical protein